MKYYHLTWAFPDAFHGNLGGILANLEIDLRHLVESLGGQESHMRCPGSILVIEESI